MPSSAIRLSKSASGDAVSSCCAREAPLTPLSRWCSADGLHWTERRNQARGGSTNIWPTSVRVIRAAAAARSLQRSVRNRLATLAPPAGLQNRAPASEQPRRTGVHLAAPASRGPLGSREGVRPRRRDPRLTADLTGGNPLELGEVLRATKAPQPKFISRLPTGAARASDRLSLQAPHAPVPR